MGPRSSRFAGVAGVAAVAGRELGARHDHGLAEDGLGLGFSGVLAPFSRLGCHSQFLYVLGLGWCGSCRLGFASGVLVTITSMGCHSQFL